MGKIFHRSFKCLLKTLFLIAFLSITPTMSADLSEQFAKNNAEFAVDLYSKVIEGKADENVIISPFSVQTCVAMAYAGASGKTAREMVTGLRLISDDVSVVASSFEGVLGEFSNSNLLKIANKIYVKSGYTLKPSFNEIARKSFHSEAESIDYDDAAASANTINGWVEEKTNHKITNLISPDNIDENTRLILINAIHFKGDWAKKFDSIATNKEEFFLNDDDSVMVDMMNQKAKFRYGDFEDLDATALEMPYANSNLSMLVFLPKTKTGLKNLEKKLKTANFFDLANQMYETEVIVKFPKFKVEHSVEMTEPLQKMGITTMFSNQATFDNLLTAKEDLKVSKVVHKAFIEVNEEGTEAAAATGMIMMMRCAMPLDDPSEFTADHPFIYAIWDNKTILFAGKLVTSAPVE